MFRISKNYCEILSILNHSEISGFEPKTLEKELNKFIYLIYFRFCKKTLHTADLLQFGINNKFVYE